MRLFKLFSILIVLLIGALFYRQSHSGLQTYEGKIFGTHYNIKINSQRKDNALENKIKDKLEEINHEMSVFDQTSEISQINQARAGQIIKLSPQLQYLLKAAAKVYYESNGAFDPTVGELVNLWGFGVDKITTTPSPEQIKSVLEYTSFNKLSFNSDFATLQKSDSRIYINLSAIAKGYGVDRVAELLIAEGYTDYMVEIGGEIRLAGTRDGTNPWSIGIAKPTEKGMSNAFVMDISDYAVATSGDYRNFFYQDGRRYAHTISPQTGYPVEHSLASVTVFHPSCMLADAYATSIMAQGEHLGMQMAERLKLPVIIFLRGVDDTITMQTSSAAQALIGD